MPRGMPGWPLRFTCFQGQVESTPKHPTKTKTSHIYIRVLIDARPTVAPHLDTFEIADGQITMNPTTM